MSQVSESYMSFLGGQGGWDGQSSGPIGLPSKASLPMEKGLGPGPAKR